MTTKELLSRIIDRLKAEGIAFYYEAPERWDYLGVVPGVEKFDESDQVITYIKPGNSEGYYFHVAAIEGKERKTLIFGKFFHVPGATEEQILGIVTRALDWSRPRTCIL